MMSLWLTACVIAAVFAAALSYRVKNLFLLSICFALNPIVVSLVEVSGSGYMLLAGVADLIMAVLCALFWCNASRTVGLFAVTGCIFNMLIFGWWYYPVPYDTFLLIYAWRPNIVRVLEASQILALFFYTPVAQSVISRFIRSKRTEDGSLWKFLITPQ